MNDFAYRFRHFMKSSPATFWLLALNTVVFLATLALGGFSVEILDRLGGLVPAYVKQGQWWRILASMFLHGGVLHFLTNMLAMFWLGRPMERIFGTKRFLVLYLGSGVAAGLTVTFLGNPWDLTVGASGSLYGVMAGLFYLTLARQAWFTRESLRSIRMMILINFAITFLFPAISVYGHLGGFLAGFLLSLALLPNIPRRDREVPDYPPGESDTEDQDPLV